MVIGSNYNLRMEDNYLLTITIFCCHGCVLVQSVHRYQNVQEKEGLHLLVIQTVTRYWPKTVNAYTNK